MHDAPHSPTSTLPAKVCEECLSTISGDTCPRHPWATLLDPSDEHDADWVAALRRIRQDRRANWMIGGGVAFVTGVFVFLFAQASSGQFDSDYLFHPTLWGLVFAVVAVQLLLIGAVRSVIGSLRRRSQLPSRVGEANAPSTPPSALDTVHDADLRSFTYTRWRKRVVLALASVVYLGSASMIFQGLQGTDGSMILLAAFFAITGGAMVLILLGAAAWLAWMALLTAWQAVTWVARRVRSPSRSPGPLLLTEDIDDPDRLAETAKRRQRAVIRQRK